MLNDHDDEPLGIADAMMRRGDHLRMLRMMAEQDEAERALAINDGNNAGGDSSSALEQDKYDVLPTSGGSKMLHYDSYLRHQRFYDDLKHIDYQYIDFGDIRSRGRDGSRATQPIAANIKSVFCAKIRGAVDQK